MRNMQDICTNMREICDTYAKQQTNTASESQHLKHSIGNTASETEHLKHSIANTASCVYVAVITSMLPRRHAAQAFPYCW